MSPKPVKNPLFNSINNALIPSYKLTVKPSSWVMPNRVRFGPWIDRTFKYKRVSYPRCTECEEGESCINISAMSLFPHQNFIKDYMQFDSPYRGLLVFHGLGSGKTCSSIAAAEILLNNMDVIIMLPASLRDNYKNEIKKCAGRFFNPMQNWMLHDKPHTVAEACAILKISPEIVKQNKGVWLPHTERQENYAKLSDTARAQIDAQINNIIENRYQFINYNGLQRKSIEKLIVNGKNPFDNKAVIIDEIHNLVSRIVNGRQIGNTLYKLLMSAENCKLILLSGTPIINYPHEVSYIMNLISGPIKYWELKAKKDSNFIKDDIEKLILDNVYVDDFTINLSSKTITIQLLPLGFHYVDRKTSRVARYTSNYDEFTSHDIIISNIVAELQSKMNVDINKKYTTKLTTLFPEKKEDFNSLFIDEEAGTIRNPRLFMKRALGTASYYNTFSPDLFPSWDIEEVPVPMTMAQFNVYEKARADERKKEGPSKFKKAGGDGLFSASGQVYRFFSRAICNFVFPENITRPFPSKLSDMKNEIDEQEDIVNMIDKVKDEEDNSKAKKIEEYQKLLAECMRTMSQKKETYLDASVVGKYSPKFERILQNIAECNGNILVYSQFRSVEGLGLLGLTLQANCWAEFKIRQENRDWVLDIDENDLHKPKYAAFTGNNEESRIILKIFNNDLDSIPEGIRNRLKQNTDNLHGDLIKMIMITQSGAEGISLKNTRQVHVIEPYWNHIRLDQVIGRAVRTCSHIALPPDERNVKIFIYYSVFSKEQIAASFTLRTLDKGATSDEYLFQIAKKKKKITDELLELIQKASADCALNAKHHGLRCFAFPVNMMEDSHTRQLDIFLEEQDTSLNRALERKEWNGQLLKTKKGNFVIKQGTKEVYDYDIYLESGKVVKVGTLTQKGDKRIIKFAE